jgi:hypothetical protein
MFERSIESTIHFSHPFCLTPFDRAQPAAVLIVDALQSLCGRLAAST